MNVNQTIKKALNENPDVRLVLDIAARARELESKEAPREIDTFTESAATPTNTQTAV